MALVMDCIWLEGGLLGDGSEVEIWWAVVDLHVLFHESK